MNLLIFIVRIVAILVLIVLQQGLIIGIGSLIYFQSSEIIGLCFLVLCIPMAYINYKTYTLIMKYGLINFAAMNADTSEIDVPKDKRWYDKNSEEKS